MKGAPCAGCGRPVAGFRPAPGHVEVPVCSRACAGSPAAGRALEAAIRLVAWATRTARGLGPTP